MVSIPLRPTSSGDTRRRPGDATHRRSSSYSTPRKPPKIPAWLFWPLLHVRALSPPVLMLILFTALLASHFVLLKPTSPARSMKIGWQAWDVVEVGSMTTATEQTGETVDEKVTDDYDVDVGLPLDVWDPLLLHKTGLTELSIQSCLAPWIYPKACYPATTPEEDATKGSWVRVEKDVNAKSGLWWLHIYYRRSRRFDVPFITDVIVLEPNDSLPVGYILASGDDFSSGAWPRRKNKKLGYRLETLDDLRRRRRRSAIKRQDDKDDESDHPGVDIDYSELLGDEDEEPSAPSPASSSSSTTPTSNNSTTVPDIEPTLSEEQHIVTELTLLYGSGPPPFGFTTIPSSSGAKDAKVVTLEDLPSNGVMNKKKWGAAEVAVIVRKGVSRAPKVEKVVFGDDGNFKIMQIADLHYSTPSGYCRDVESSFRCEGDPTSEELIGQVLDVEKPGFVVFSGDQLNGQGSSWDAESVLAKFAAPVIARKIPWALIFGNHDSEETTLSREGLMRYVERMPYSVSSRGPAEVAGVGNYLVKVYSPDASRIHLLSLYFLDSHDYMKQKNPFAQHKYDYIKQNQIDWYLKTSASVASIERPFTPDGVDDLGGIWKTKKSTKRRLDEENEKKQTKTLKKPNALMFFHIPLPESVLPPDISPINSEPLHLGQNEEGDGGSETNSYLLANGLLQASDGTVQLGDGIGGQHIEPEVKVVGNGHVHTADDCGRHQGVWLCFGGGGSYSGYGKVGFERRFRIYDVSKWGEKITTYKHTDSGAIIDKEDLVGGDAPALR